MNEHGVSYGDELNLLELDGDDSCTAMYIVCECIKYN